MFALHAANRLQNVLAGCRPTVCVNMQALHIHSMHIHSIPAVKADSTLDRGIQPCMQVPLEHAGNAGLLQQSNASNATYLFQPDKLNREYDLGDKTIQCGRRADAFKLWLAWKVILHSDPIF